MNRECPGWTKGFDIQDFYLFKVAELIKFLVNFITLSSVFGSVTFTFTTGPEFRVNPLLGLYLHLTVHVFMVIILYRPNSVSHRTNGKQTSDKEFVTTFRRKT